MKRSLSHLALTAALGLLVVAGCSKKAEQPVTDTAVVAEPAKPAQPAAPEVAHVDCVGPISTGEAKVTKIGAVEWEQSGSTLTMKAAEGKRDLVIGTLSDIKETTDENKANLEAFITWFKEKQVDVVVVAGDSGLDQAQIETSLTQIASAGVPVFAIIGNREGRDSFKAAIANVQAKHPNLFSLNQIRRIDTPAVDLISMPGYYNAAFIHADVGCPYHAADVAALGELTKASNSPVLLVSHGGPKGVGEKAIDYTSQKENVGDPMLNQAIADHSIAFGIFGNVHEAGGKATNADGSELLESGKPYETMFLNPGPVDAVRWPMNDGTESAGMAAIMSISDGKATYEIKKQPVADVAQK